MFYLRNLFFVLLVMGLNSANAIETYFVVIAETGAGGSVVRTITIGNDGIKVSGFTDDRRLIILEPKAIEHLRESLVEIVNRRKRVQNQGEGFLIAFNRRQWHWILVAGDDVSSVITPDLYMHSFDAMTIVDDMEHEILYAFMLSLICTVELSVIHKGPESDNSEAMNLRWLACVVAVDKVRSFLGRDVLNSDHWHFVERNDATLRSLLERSEFMDRFNVKGSSQSVDDFIEKAVDLGIPVFEISNPRIVDEEDRSHIEADADIHTSVIVTPRFQRESVVELLQSGIVEGQIEDAPPPDAGKLDMPKPSSPDDLPMRSSTEKDRRRLRM